MESITDRLKWARLNAGYSGPTEAAVANGWRPPTYLAHENGTRGIPKDKAKLYADRFRVRVEWLMFGRGSPKGRNKIPVVGYVGAGAEIFPIDDHAKGTGLEEIAAPAEVEGPCVAVEIQGDSMWPLKPGWRLVYRRDSDGVPDRAINHLCVVRERDGPTLVKELQRGSSRGLYRLVSWNAPPREDVALDWAAEVIEIRIP